MPLDLTASNDDLVEQNRAQATAAEEELRDPLALGGRSKAFCEWVLRVTLNGTLTMSAEDFNELSDAYDKLEGIERLEVRSTLARHQIYWTTTFESADDGYDDEDNGYETYKKLATVKP